MNFQLAQGQVTFKDSVFKNIKQGKENTFSNVIFYRNMAEQQISFINCQIETIEIYVFILFDSLTMQQNVLFQNLTYDTNKSPLFNSYNTNINISDSTFSNNLHSKSLIGVKDSSSLILYSSTFSNNSPQNQNPLIDIINSQSNSIYNCAFLSNVYENGVMISAKYSNLEISELVTTGNTANGIFELYIVDAQIKSLQAINDNCMRYMEVKISDVALKNNSFANIDRFLLVEYSNATLENIKIQNTNDLIFSCLDSNFTVNSISISDSIGKIAIDTCKVQIDSSSFQNYQGTASIVSSDLLIGNVLFNHSKGLQIDSSTVKLKELNSISCDSALVLNNSLVSIDNSNFLLNSNTAIRSSYSTLQVNSSYFEENSGENGGGIYIAYSDLKLEKSCFFGNKADKGGGIFVELSNLQYDEFTSENNTAGYGDNIAGIPAYLVEYFNNEVFVSGKPVENLTFAITDPYNQVILTDNSSYLTISISNSSGFIQGSSKIIATQGLFRLEDLQFFTMPGEYADFTITSSLSPEISLNFSLYFRECLAGEVQLSDNSCKTCENNTYSLSTNDSYCNSCPSSAICFGSNKIYPNLGYWSDPAYPANLYPCMNINACLKGSDSSENNCAYSYNGTLCANCISGYKLKGSYICNKCPEYWVSVAIVATGSLVILALIVFLVYSNIKSVDKQKSDIALLLKVFVNYCQTIMLFSQIELKWPVSILHLFNFSNMVGDSSNQMLTLSCDTVIQSETTSISETIIITFLPCLLGFIAFVIWGIVSIRKKSIRYLKVHFVSTLVVILFLMQTSVSNTLLSLISCKKINGKYYNTKDFSLECYTSKHLEILYEIAIPGIFLWCFIIPIGVFFFMFKNRKNLNERDTKIKFKTLFAGFSERLFFWEFLIFARKFLIRLIAILLISSGVSIQGLGIMVVLVLALVAHLMYLPYEKKEINSLEFFCIITLCMYAAGGILFDSQISDFSKEIIGWLLFALNFLFITSWAKHFFRAIYEALAKSNLFAKLLARLKRKNPRKVANYFSDAVENKAVDQDSRLADHSVNHLLFPENPNNSCEVSDDSNLSYISEDIVQRPNAWTVRFQSD